MVERSDTHHGRNMGIASLHPSYGTYTPQPVEVAHERRRLSQCEIPRPRHCVSGVDDIVSSSTPFPIPFLSVYWYTKPGADPCKNEEWE